MDNEKDTVNEKERKNQKRKDYIKQKKSPPPEKPPSFREAVRMIASLGGFLGRKGDGEPGVKTIWLGLRRLHDISQTWKLSHQISSPIEPP